MTSFWTMTSRTIGRSNGAARPRTIVRTTVVPFLPRTLAGAASDRQPIDARPVDRERPVAGQQAGLRGGRAGGRRDHDEGAAVPERRRRLRRRSTPAGPDLGADPLELAGQALERLAVLFRAE